MVASCCRFLCYFCRISRQNQKAMFDHLSYLLENSSVGLGEHFDIILKKEYNVLKMWNLKAEHRVLRKMMLSDEEYAVVRES